ncbi:MAG: efflux RND transporter periplasmic adaptor subunit [Betaproteobacteria bacterium]|nr:MAG: efflux RND transporter periplasmic adaptor subunit [Betaproteobacteria bacterium]
MKLMMILAAVAVTLMACGGEAPEGHAHGDAAADAAQAPQRLTHFGEKTELFVEFPALVVGQTATFVAHFTQLADFKPVAQGRVTVLLSGDGRAEERFEVAAPTVPGIFKVGVTPAQPGDRDLSLIVNTAQGPLTHELGPVTVFTDAKAAAPSVAAEGGIPFSKEQQWRVDFATLEAVQGSARPSVTATATIRALPDGAAQMTAPVAGVLRSAGAFPRIGQVVKKGQVLLWLTPRLGGDTDYAALQATVSKARIALEAARRERARLEALFKEEAVPERRVFEARATEAMAEAEATAAHARLGGLSDGGGGVAMRAPIDGRIVDVAVGAGGFVAEGAPLFHIANSTRLWLEARVAESEMGRLGVPTAAAFWVDGVTHAVLIEPGKGGRLIAVGGMVDAVTRTVPVIFEFTPPAGTALRLGMMARAQVFAGAGQKAVLVPASAVQDESGTAVVYVQTGGESFERRIVQTGAREGDRIAIVAGIEAGQRVVSRGAYLIRLSTSKAGPAGHAH